VRQEASYDVCDICYLWNFDTFRCAIISNISSAQMAMLIDTSSPLLLREPNSPRKEGIISVIFSKISGS